MTRAKFLMRFSDRSGTFILEFREEIEKEIPRNSHFESKLTTAEIPTLCRPVTVKCKVRIHYTSPKYLIRSNRIRRTWNSKSRRIRYAQKIIEGIRCRLENGYDPGRGSGWLLNWRPQVKSIFDGIRHKIGSKIRLH